MLKQPDLDEVVEKAKNLNAPLTPELPASDETGFDFRPLTEDEKKAFMKSLGAEGRQKLAKLETISVMYSSSVA
jgi:hypothetical protein